MQAFPQRSLISHHSQCVSPAPPEDIQGPLLDVRDVKLGLRKQEFHAYLQPKFELLTGHPYAVEVLARWQHPQQGLLGPAHFIALMNREHLLGELFFTLLEQSLACQLRLHAQGRLLGFALNLSLGQLHDGQFVERLATRLREHPLPASTLTLEITEDGPASATPGCIEQLRCLSGLGVRLSMDDFGTGYSSLWRLCQVPFSEIKLAGEFTRLLDTHEDCRAVVRHTVALAAQMGLQLVAEGIETRRQRVLLAELGVRYGQGFLCSKPEVIGRSERWLRASGSRI